MTGYMYILKCCDDSYYTGSTTNLELRLAQHVAGEGANHTKKHLPVELVYFEKFSRIDEAFYREKQVQGWSRKKKEALIENRQNDLPMLSKNYTQNTASPSTSSDAVSETVISTVPESVPELVEGTTNEFSETIKRVKV